MPRTLILFLLSLAALSLPAQSHYNVIAPSGLFIRDFPGQDGYKLGKLPPGIPVKLLERSGKSFSLEDQGRQISGEWVKVQHPQYPVGYVFDGYLLAKKGDGEDEIGCDDVLPCDTRIEMHEAWVTLFGYQTEGLRRLHPDTLFTYEHVFNDPADKLIQIRPKQEVRSIQLFMTARETITHQYDPKQPDQPRARWIGHEAFQEIEGERGFFLLPALPPDQEEIRQAELGLRDTLVDNSGESWDVATLIYKDKPSLYVIDEVWLKVLITQLDGSRRAEYLRIELSFGC